MKITKDHLAIRLYKWTQYYAIGLWNLDDFEDRNLTINKRIKRDLNTCSLLRTLLIYFPIVVVWNVGIRLLTVSVFIVALPLNLWVLGVGIIAAAIIAAISLLLVFCFQFPLKETFPVATKLAEDYHDKVCTKIEVQDEAA